MCWPRALLCLSCLAVPYDPTQAKPLCQEEISGVTVQRCMGPCFNYMLQTPAPCWAHCCSHTCTRTHTKTKHENTVMQESRISHTLTHKARRHTPTLMQPLPSLWFPNPPTLLLGTSWPQLKRLCSVQMQQIGSL